MKHLILFLSLGLLLPSLAFSDDEDYLLVFHNHSPDPYIKEHQTDHALEHLFGMKEGEAPKELIAVGRAIEKAAKDIKAISPEKDYTPPTKRELIKLVVRGLEAFQKGDTAEQLNFQQSLRLLTINDFTRMSKVVEPAVMYYMEYKVVHGLRSDPSVVQNMKFPHRHKHSLNPGARFSEKTNKEDFEEDLEILMQTAKNYNWKDLDHSRPVQIHRSTKWADSIYTYYSEKYCSKNPKVCENNKAILYEDIYRNNEELRKAEYNEVFKTPSKMSEEEIAQYFEKHMDHILASDDDFIFLALFKEASDAIRNAHSSNTFLGYKDEL